MAGLLALALAQGIGRFAFTPILPIMQEDAGVSLAEGGWLAAANYLGYLVGALWAMVQPARSDHAIRACPLCRFARDSARCPGNLEGRAGAIRAVGSTDWKRHRRMVAW